jgi:hypothetical protein
VAFYGRTQTLLPLSSSGSINHELSMLLLLLRAQSHLSSCEINKFNNFSLSLRCGGGRKRESEKFGIKWVQ